MYRLDQRLDAMAGLETEGLGPFAGNGVDEARDLDRLEVVEAELVAWSNAERSIGGVVRAG